MLVEYTIFVIQPVLYFIMCIYRILTQMKPKMKYIKIFRTQYKKWGKSIDLSFLRISVISLVSFDGENQLSPEHSGLEFKINWMKKKSTILLDIFKLLV